MEATPAAVEIFLRNQSSQKTESTYRWALGKWFTWLGDREASPSLALDFRKFLEDNLSSRSAALVFNTVRVYYRSVGNTDIFERIKSPRRIKNATPQVPEDSLVDKMLSMCYDERDRAIMSLALNGLRGSEIVHLTTESFWYSGSLGAWMLKVIGKGNKERIVPATSEAVKSLLAYSQTVPETRSWLLLSREGERLTLRQVQYVVERYSRLAGSEFRPHRLRHHYATRLIRAGADVFSVQRLLGHENISSTNVYVNLDLADVINAARKDPRNETETA